MAITLARALKNRVPRVDMKREPVINPAIARPLLGLHRASNVDSFSKAVQQLLSALHRLWSLEREHTVRTAFEELLRRLPLPTILLRWNLRLVYQNQAARDFCAVWEKGPNEARLINTRSPVPPEILDRCRQLKQQWPRAKRPSAPLRF